MGTIGGEPIDYHRGDNPGYRSLLMWMPGRRTVLCALSNDDSSSLPAFAAALADDVFPRSGSEER